MAGYTVEPTTILSSKDANAPITETLLSSNSNAESARTTFIESKITTISEWDTTSQISASMPPNSVTVLVASSTLATTIYSTSMSIFSELSRSSSTSTKWSSPDTVESFSSSSSSSIFPSSTSSSYSTTSATSASTLVAISLSASCSSTCSYSSSSSSSSSSSTTSSTSSTSSTSPRTSSLRFSTCAYPTATTVCPTVTATGLAYKQYYAGEYYTENTANPGTGGEPAIYTRFRRSYDMCAAAQYCANAAAAAYGPYHSFDLHYTCSNSSWMCVQYFNGNSDASYFNVLNLDVVIAFGYSY